MSSTILIHSSRYSQKVWGYDVYVNNQTGKSNVITFYGKLGKSMQKLTKRNKWFDNFADCHNWIMKKVDKKRREKGYFICKRSEYFDKIEEELDYDDLFSWANKKHLEMGN